MWRKTEEVKATSPGADAAEPAATTSNLNSSATPPAENSATSEAAAPAFTSSSAIAPDVAAAITTVSTISAGLKIRGDISGNCHLVVEGETHGKIHLANGRVTVATSGRVNADIEAPEIEIEGNVQGNLHARDNVRMGPASHVQGSVLTRRIRIEDGARFRGKVEMTRPGSSADSSGGKSSQVTAAASPVNAEKPKIAAAAAPRS
jgi:cytoskeletal protein CcmA (bactofilin family)